MHKVNTYFQPHLLMNPLFTSRLRLQPLTFSQLRLFSTNLDALERQLGLEKTQLQLSAGDTFITMLHMALADFTLPKTEQYPADAVWFTHWLIIHTESNKRIGGIGASGPPAAQGETQIGYFIDERMERQGFATEAVTAFTHFLFSHPQLHKVSADTLTDGIASQRVLQKCGFRFQQPVEEGLRWELRR